MKIYRNTHTNTAQDFILMQKQQTPTLSLTIQMKPQTYKFFHFLCVPTTLAHRLLGRNKHLLCLVQSAKIISLKNSILIKTRQPAHLTFRLKKISIRITIEKGVKSENQKHSHFESWFPNSAMIFYKVLKCESGFEVICRRTKIIHPLNSQTAVRH